MNRLGLDDTLEAGNSLTIGIDYNRLLVKLPFGDLVCRYLSNGMGFFNPHVDSNYLMSLGEYVSVFFKYMFRAQPLIIWTWFYGNLRSIC